jgi:hypothetical protein
MMGASPKMTTTETCHYRGYDIVPTRLWSSWCVGVYRTRADIPLMAQSTLNTFAPRLEEAVDEAKQSIDRALDNRRATSSTVIGMSALGH